MHCRRIQPHLLAFIEGELTQRKRGKVALHMAACPACASVLRGLQQTLHMVQAMDVPEPSPAFWEAFGTALHQRIHHAEAVHSGRSRFPIRDFFLLPKPVLVAAAVSLMLVSSLPFLHRPWEQKATPSIVITGGGEASLAADLDFLKHLDLLEEVDVLEQFDTAL
jgi:Putative zinc-finger